MNAKDYVFDAIYKGALKRGAKEQQAKDAAVVGLDLFRKSKYKKLDKMIEAQIKFALKK
jgi:hypothetical protein